MRSFCSLRTPSRTVKKRHHFWWKCFGCSCQSCCCVFFPLFLLILFPALQKRRPPPQWRLHRCPFNEVISRHTGADVARKTHCDVIVIDARLPPHPLHNSVDGIRITTCIMWRQLSPQSPGSHGIGSRLISGRGGKPIRVIYSLLVSSTPWNLCSSPDK